MKFYVHFSTIQPRFCGLNHVLNSWKNQTINIENVIISSSKLDKRFYNDISLYNVANTFPKTKIQILEYDYGPHNKILGALQFYESITDKDNSYIIICDDDIIYSKNTAKSYKESLLINKNTIYTHFNTHQRLKNINHLQGADSYILTPQFLKTTTFESYKKYLDDILNECPDCLYQDDYVISYFIYNHTNLEIQTVENPYSHTLSPSSNIFQLHFETKVHEREKTTILYLNKKNNF